MTDSRKEISSIEHVEEKLNAVTHGIGAGLSIAGLVLLLVLSGDIRDPWRFVSFSIYGTFQILLYLTSSLTHAFHDMPRASYYFRIMDQASVYLLIAGTYTPAALVLLRGPVGWTIFGLEWGLAICGILSKTLFFKEKNIISDLFYVPMGWLIAVFAGPLVRSSPQGLVMWIFLGGACYTLGVLFYMIKKIPFGHVIWHIFVIAGGFSFFLGYAIHLT
jgi:hemolysin III